MGRGAAAHHARAGGLAWGKAGHTLSGVSLHTQRPRGGKHAACKPGWSRSLWLAAAVPIGIAIGLTAVATILGANLAVAVRRAGVALWGHMGPVGQLAAEAAGCMLAGRAAGNLGMIPDGTLAPAALGAGGVIGLVIMHRRRGRLQRAEWVESRGRGMLILGGARQAAEGCDARYSANAGRLESVEARLDALEMGLARVGAAAGHEIAAATEPPGAPQLHVVRN